MTANLAATGQLPPFAWVPIVIALTVLSLWITWSRFRQMQRSQAEDKARETKLQAYLSERDEEGKRSHGGRF